MRIARPLCSGAIPGASWRVLGAVLRGACGDAAHAVEDNRHAGLAPGVWMQESWQAVQELVEVEPGFERSGEKCAEVRWGFHGLMHDLGPSVQDRNEVL